jgi:uncharacterized membrane protein
MYLIPLLVVATAIGSAAVGGTYLAFSVMVMPALRRLTAGQATAAMLEINRTAEKGAFRVIFSVALVFSLALPIWVIGLPGTPTVLDFVAGLLAFASALVTIVANIPLNNRLVREGAGFWDQYDRRWTRLNTVRAVLALGAVGVIAFAATLDR